MVDVQLVVELVGLGVAVVTFFVTYLRDKGAKQERVRTAYKETLDVLTRSFVRDGVNPTLDVIDSVVGKASRDHDVKSNDIPSSMNLLDDVTANIVANDYLDRTQKESLIQRMVSLKRELRVKPEAAVAKRIDTTSEAETVVLSLALSLGLGIFAIAAVTAYQGVELASVASTLITEVAVVGVVLVGIATLTYQRDVQAKYSSEVASEARDFVSAVELALKEAFPQTELKSRVRFAGREFDYEVKANGTYVVEVKYSRRPIGLQVLRALRSSVPSGAKLVMITNAALEQVARDFAVKHAIGVVEGVRSEEEMVESLRRFGVTDRTGEVGSR